MKKKILIVLLVLVALYVGYAVALLARIGTSDFKHTTPYCTHSGEITSCENQP